MVIIKSISLFFGRSDTDRSNIVLVLFYRQIILKYEIINEKNFNIEKKIKAGRFSFGIDANKYWYSVVIICLEALELMFPRRTYIRYGRNVSLNEFQEKIDEVDYGTF